MGAPESHISPKCPKLAPLASVALLQLCRSKSSSSPDHDKESVRLPGLLRSNSQRKTTKLRRSNSSIPAVHQGRSEAAATIQRGARISNVLRPVEEQDADFGEQEKKKAEHKRAHVFAVGDRVTISKLGSHVGEHAVVTKAKAWEHDRITVKMEKDGSTKSYCEHELKAGNLPSQQPKKRNTLANVYLDASS